MNDDITRYKGRYLSLLERNGWEFASRSNATGVVVLVAVTDSREIVLVEQFRKPIGMDVIELPAGLVGDLDDTSETTLVAAARELEEETGFTAAHMEILMECPSSAGMSDEAGCRNKPMQASPWIRKSMQPCTGCRKTRFLDMYRHAITIILSLIVSGAMSMTVIADPGAAVAIAIHAGSGTIRKGDFSDAREQEVRETLERAVKAGHQILASGGSSLDAVTLAITILEDSPHFNAGKGAVFNAEARNELDASIMDGSNLSAGAVAAVHNIRNPIAATTKSKSQSQAGGLPAFGIPGSVVFHRRCSRNGP